MRAREFNNEIKPAIPLIFLVDTGTIEIEDSGTYLTWDTVLMKTNHFTYNTGDTKITLASNESGIFRLHFDCSVFEEIAGCSATRFQIYKNGTQILTSRSECRSTDPDDAVHCGIFYYIYLEKGDYIEVRGVAIFQHAITMANTSRIALEWIPMKGWNNNSGGKENYTGGVMR